MMITRLLLAGLAATVALLLVNLFVFPLVFGNGMPLPYSDLRPQPLLAYNAVALLVTGLLIAAVCSRAAASIAASSTVAALCGLLASMPSALHTLSLVEIAPGSQIAPVLWTVVTWGIAGSTAGAVLHRGSAPDRTVRD